MRRWTADSGICVTTSWAASLDPIICKKVLQAGWCWTVLLSLWMPRWHRGWPGLVKWAARGATGVSYQCHLHVLLFDKKKKTTFWHKMSLIVSLYEKRKDCFLCFSSGFPRRKCWSTSPLLNVLLPPSLHILSKIRLHQQQALGGAVSVVWFLGSANMQMLSWLYQRDVYYTLSFWLLFLPLQLGLHVSLLPLHQKDSGNSVCPPYIPRDHAPQKHF